MLASARRRGARLKMTPAHSRCLLVLFVLVLSGCSNSAGWEAPPRAEQASRDVPNLARPDVPTILGTLGDQLFAHNSADLDDEGLKQIDDAADQLNSARYSGILCVVGYTDGTGSEGTNLRIATMRAETVKRELEKSWSGSIEILPIGEQGATDNVADPERRRVDLVTDSCDERKKEWN